MAMAYIQRYLFLNFMPLKRKVYTFAEYCDKQDPIAGCTFSLYLCLVKKLESIARYKSLNTSN